MRCSLAWLFVPVFLAIPGVAQAEELPANIVLADLGLHVVSFGAQRTVYPWLAAQFSAGLYGPWTQTGHLLEGGKVQDPDIVGFALRGRVFVYPFGEAPTGLWLSPFGQFGVAGTMRGNESLTGPVAALGLSAGYAVLLARHLHIALGLGGQYHAAQFRGGAPSFAGFYPTVDINVGYAF